MEDCVEPGEERLTEYELQRLQRIKENNAALAALDLPALAASLQASAASAKKRKGCAEPPTVVDAPRRSVRLGTQHGGGRKVLKDLSSSSDEEFDAAETELELASRRGRRDVEYKPSEEEQAEEEEEMNSGSGSDHGEPQPVEPVHRGNSKGEKVQAGAKTARQLSTSSQQKKKGKAAARRQSLVDATLEQELGPSGDGMSHVPDDLQKARALSMGHPVAEGGLPADSGPGIPTKPWRRKISQKQQLKKTNKKDHMILSEDEIVKLFFLIDERVTGYINLAMLKRIASAQDFMWTNEELQDMINLFDEKKAGKLSLEAFRNIVARCNMLPC